MKSQRGWFARVVAMVGEGARRALNPWRRTTVSLLMLLLVFKRTDTHRLLGIWSTINLRLIAAGDTFADSHSADERAAMVRDSCQPRSSDADHAVPEHALCRRFLQPNPANLGR